MELCHASTKLSQAASSMISKHQGIWGNSSKTGNSLHPMTRSSQHYISHAGKQYLLYDEFPGENLTTLVPIASAIIIERGNQLINGDLERSQVVPLDKDNLLKISS